MFSTKFHPETSSLFDYHPGFNAVVSKSHESHHAIRAPIVQTYHAPAAIVSPTYVHHAPTYVAHAPVISHAAHAIVSHHAPAYVSHTPVYAHSAPILHHAPVYTHTTLLHK